MKRITLPLSKIAKRLKLWEDVGIKELDRLTASKRLLVALKEGGESAEEKG